MEYRQGKLKYADLIRQRSGEVYGFFFYIPLFFLLSFFGWLWEVGIYLVKDGEFVNRGVLFGPWLPVYGCGGIISGRVCLLGGLLFGVGGWLLVCYAVPYLRLLYRKIWRKEKGRRGLQLVCLMLLLIFIADAARAADFPNMGKDITMEKPAFE